MGMHVQILIMIFKYENNIASKEAARCELIYVCRWRPVRAASLETY
jgi:hypothetical protein